VIKVGGLARTRVSRQGRLRSFTKRAGQEAGAQVFKRVSRRTDAVEKGVFTIENADPMHALKTLRMLSRRECWVRRRFSTPSTQSATLVFRDFDRSRRWPNILIEFLPAILQKDFANDSEPLAKFIRDIDCIKYVWMQAHEPTEIHTQL
jgi:hypothetical protein